MKPSPRRSPLSLGERKRLSLVFIGLFGLFALLLMQFYKIQILEHEKWKKIATSQHFIMVEEPARRGLFYPNDSLRVAQSDALSPFVIDIPKFHLYIDPVSIPPAYRPAIIEKLLISLHLDQPEKEKLIKQFEKKSRSRKLVMWIDQKKHEEILQWWNPFAKQRKIARNALFFVQDWKRSYPYGKLLGQVLHTVRDDRDPKTHRGIPTGGLETIFDKLLAGKEGKRLIMRSPRHPLDEGRLITPPEHGADIYLTIDHTIQAIAEEEIEKAVKKAHATSGWAVMMDPYTGEVLAWAQYPFFKPASYREFFNDPKQLDNTKAKCITDPHEPGSIFKPFTIACGLLGNVELAKRGKPPLFTTTEKISTWPRAFPGRTKIVHEMGRSHRFLDMYLGLQKSSNNYMSTIAMRIVQQLGVDWYRSTLQDVFGFGVKTGIELPGESVGLLPRPGKKHPNGTFEWSPATPYSLSMGHNILTNGLQILRAYAILANGGFEVRPTLIRKIVKEDSKGEKIVLLDNTIKAPKKRLIPPEVLFELIKALKYVTKPGGSGARADLYGYTEVGKTGTSEKVVTGAYSKKNHISSFCGFAPLSKPRFVLLIAIDEPEYKYIPGVGKNHSASVCAAPVFREIGSKTLEYLGVEPDDPYGYPSGDPRRDEGKADWYKEVKELAELYKRWNGG